jgi:hypothetical protein
MIAVHNLYRIAEGVDVEGAQKWCTEGLHSRELISGRGLVDT